MTRTPHVPVAKRGQVSTLTRHALMSAFTHLPLGQCIPDSPHAVSCSLPTMRAVRGYEEKDPAIMGQLTSGYPRFVVHPFSRQLAAHLSATLPALAGRTLWLTSSARMADALATILQPATPATATFSHDGLHGAAHAESSDASARAKTFLQNVGGFLSSREAEDHLVRIGLTPAPYPENQFIGDSATEVRRLLHEALPGTVDADLILTNCGMNAVYGAFRASADLQANRGRTVWIQLGWLYLDTIAILKRFTRDPSDYVYVRDPLNYETIERIFAKHGSRIAGVLAELPTNPLIQTPDIAKLCALCRAHGAHLLIDSSVASPFNVTVLHHCDVLVGSLTKYCASEGDIIAGVVAINPAGPDATELRARATASIEPLYSRDLARLALQIGKTYAVIDRINENTGRVAAFLESHPKVRQVFWALQSDSRDNYQKIARTPQSTGGMISFTLRIPLDPFYDRLRLPKGPSFGMTTTLICPFMYLAHYNLVTTPAGIAELAASGLDPDLLRLCCGTEPAGEIIAALEEALG